MKILKIDHEKCTGCKICELACSLWHEQILSPKRARIRVIKEWPDIDVPMVCLQCLTAPCAKACPVDAISLDRKFGVMIEENKCIGCQKCILACPVAAIWMHPTKNIALKCDLCLGDPVCTKYCPTGVISLVEIDRFLGDKQASYGKRFSKVHKRA